MYVYSVDMENGREKMSKQFIQVKRGSEGPAHDPYGYVEVAFHRMNGDVIICHIGLSAWIKLNGKKVEVRQLSGDFDDYYNAHERKFLELTGIKFMKAVDIPDILEQRHVRSMSKEDRRSYWQMRAIDIEMFRNSY